MRASCCTRLERTRVPVAANVCGQQFRHGTNAVCSAIGFGCSIIAGLTMLLAAPAAHAACQITRYAELPVTMQGLRPVVTGSLNGVEGEFLTDTGAFFSMISQATAERLKLRPQPLPGRIEVRGASGTAPVGLVTIKELSLNGFGSGHKVDFLVGGNAVMQGLLGIIGQNVIGQADTEFDLAGGAIRLFHTKDCKETNLAYWHGKDPVAIVPIRELTPAQPQLVGDVMLNGVKIAVLLDSGAERSMLDFKAARRAGIKLDGPEVQAGGVLEGINGKSFETWLTHFDSLDIDGELIRNARLRIADVEVPAGADMVLGADFFLSHRIYVATSLRRVFITYNGGHVFDLRQPATESAGTAAPDTTMDAAALRRRAAALSARRDFAGAIADLDRAIELAPDDAETYHRRGIARWESGDKAGAAADFDEAVKRKPDDVIVLMDRGTVRLSSDDQEGARADFERVASLAPNDATLVLNMASAYERYGHLSEAVSRLDRWVAANPRDDRLPAALAERCWALAMLGTDLDRALSDCNGALRNGQRIARNLDGRALVWLRLGKYDKAISDYRAALELQPRAAHARFGLGLAEFHKGQHEAGEADMKAAVEMRASIADEFKQQGLTPE